MGYWKNIEIEIMEGYADPRVTNGKTVCADCFDEPGIKSFINDLATDLTCDFCGATSGEAISLDLRTVANHIVDCLQVEYDDANNWGYVPKTFSTWDVLEHAGVYCSDSSGDLFDTLVDSLPDKVFCPRNPYGLDEKGRLVGGWKALAGRLKSERRFFFGASSEDRDIVSPSEILDVLAQEIVDLGLIKDIRAGTVIYRARAEKKRGPFTTPSELGPPRSDQALISNRMSPPGIVMTYLGEDEKTALLETVRSAGDYSVGSFELLRDVCLIDLATLPPVPSLFDTEERRVQRGSLSFLHDFAADVSQPIAHDDRVHIEYIPTQVVTEYFREVFPRKHFGVDGVRYQSAANPGGVSIVLFADRKDVEGTDEQIQSQTAPMLKLVASTSRFIGWAV